MSSSLPIQTARGKRIRQLVYVADFRYFQDGQTVVEDVKSKGTRTAQYRIKKKLFEQRYYPLTITEVGG